MSYLIQLKQKIRTVETIKKITHAMRLISMSAHTRMKSKELFLKEYIQASRTLLNKLKGQFPHWKSPLLDQEVNSNKLTIILIGSQKGLCASFNSSLFKLFERTLEHSAKKDISLIVVGKKAIDYLANHPMHATIIKSYPTLNSGSLSLIAHDILLTLLAMPAPLGSVTIMSNKVKTFFIQKPQITQLIPFFHQGEHTTSAEVIEEYLWPQDAITILDNLLEQCIQVQIHYHLFQSLLAEQAARFLSMDSSTRNAQTVLETSRLMYNKLRQAQITKELNELTGGL